MSFRVFEFVSWLGDERHLTIKSSMKEKAQKLKKLGNSKT